MAEMDTNAAWTPWHGAGQPPIEDGVPFLFRFRDGFHDPTPHSNASELRWTHEGHDGDIIAYRMVGEPAGTRLSARYNGPVETALLRVYLGCAAPIYFGFVMAGVAYAAALVPVYIYGSGVMIEGFLNAFANVFWR